jgi:hypothetical protein
LLARIAATLSATVTRVRAFLSILAIAFVACGKGESSSEIAQVAKETLSSVRAREIVSVQVRLDKPEPPSPAELEVRKQIEEQIEQQHVGAIVQTTTDVGHYDLSIEVESTTDAVPRVRTILRDAGVLERATVRVETKK